MKGILLSGALGRMGAEITRAAGDFGFEIAAGIDVKTGEAAYPLYKSLALCNTGADLLMDFSRAGQTDAAVAYARAHALPLLCGTSGLQRAQEALLRKAASDVPVFYSANYSPGAHALLLLARQAAALCARWDIEIVERHHAAKPDAPGGTALQLYEAVAKPDSLMVCGRNAAARPRDKREIGVHALRAGTLTGEHEVGFYGAEETLLLTHRVQGRAVFARGALRAARFLLEQRPGLYGMDDLLRAQPGES